jgi:3-isopropylmalate/(R)-2-methylmalate dehydratase large subunit
MIRNFVKEFKIDHLYEGNKGGIEHVLLPEKGIVTAGDFIIGADSHTCTYGGLGAFSTGVGSTDFAFTMLTGQIWLRVPKTIRVVFFGKPNKWVYGKDLILKIIGDIKTDGALYKTLEFSGETIHDLPMAERFTMCNMVIEAGAKNGIIEPDEVTKQYLSDRSLRSPRYYKSDLDAQYQDTIEYDCSKIDPLIAFPNSPENVRSIYDINHIEIDQVVIGSCTNGWFTDLRIAADIIKGKKVNKNVRLLIFPATYEIYKQAIKEGLIQVFAEAGGIISPPSCGPCLGGHLGVLAQGERCVATTNRNFIGRMGHLESEVYLTNPAIAAASAILGRIGIPDELN